MKKILSFTAVLMLAAMSFMPTREKSIANAFENGDAETLSEFLDNYIDISLPGKSEIRYMGKTQAKLALRAFFLENKAKGFSIFSQRENAGVMYIAGKLKASTRDFNVILLISKKDKQEKILTMRIF